MTAAAARALSACSSRFFCQLASLGTPVQRGDKFHIAYGTVYCVKLWATFTSSWSLQTAASRFGFFESLDMAMELQFLSRAECRTELTCELRPMSGIP